MNDQSITNSIINEVSTATNQEANIMTDQAPFADLTNEQIELAISFLELKLAEYQEAFAETETAIAEVETEINNLDGLEVDEDDLHAHEKELIAEDIVDTACRRARDSIELGDWSVNLRDLFDSSEFCDDIAEAAVSMFINDPEDYEDLHDDIEYFRDIKAKREKFETEREALEDTNKDLDSDIGNTAEVIAELKTELESANRSRIHITLYYARPNTNAEYTLSFVGKDFGDLAYNLGHILPLLSGKYESRQLVEGVLITAYNACDGLPVHFNLGDSSGYVIASKVSKVGK